MTIRAYGIRYTTAAKASERPAGMGLELRRIEALRLYCVGDDQVSQITESVNAMIGITDGVIDFSPHLLTLEQCPQWLG